MFYRLFVSVVFVLVSGSFFGVSIEPLRFPYPGVVNGFCVQVLGWTNYTIAENHNDYLKVQNGPSECWFYLKNRFQIHISNSTINSVIVPDENIILPSFSHIISTPSVIK